MASPTSSGMMVLILMSFYTRKFDIGFEEFSKVISVLLPLTPVVESALTGKKYHAFIKDGLALVKQEAKHDN
jgi:hypothetical protein